MASKQEVAELVISMLPWRPGLMTSGQQSSIPETELWKAKNVGPDLDGMMSKRPGLTKWGQTIKSPDKSATDSTLTAFVDWLSGTSGFTATDNSGSASISPGTNRGVLQTNTGIGSGNKNYSLSYNVSALSLNLEWSVRFMFRGTNLPAYTASGTAPNTFVVRAQGTSATAKEFAIWSGGIYWKQASDSTYVKVTDSDIAGAGAWNVIEIQCDDNSGNTLVYLNDTLLQTLTSADLEDVTITGTAAFEFRWEVEGSGLAGTQYTTYVSTPMYNDTISTPFTADAVVAIDEYQYVTGSGTLVRSLLMAAGNYIYHDRGLEAGWRPLHTKQRSNVHFSQYRTTIVWSDNDGGSAASVWQWDGVNAVEHLDEAPPVRFLAEHQDQLVGWGDIKNPRRLYYSAPGEPNVWFAPSPSNTESEFDVLITAGYLSIPSRGVEVKAFVGDYFGTGVIAGEKGFWKVSGYGVFSYRLDGLKVGTGAINAQSMVQVGNDIWALGPQGIVSVSASEKFGDLQASFPSLPIQNLWSTDSSTGDSINETYLPQVRMTHTVRKAAVFIGVPLVGSTKAEDIYVYNTTTQKFYGPWEVKCQALASVQVASPVTEVTMVGGTDGNIGYFNPFTRQDFGGNGYSMEIETASLNGRSINPRFVGLNKNWRRVRLYVLPRGDWDYTLEWWTDTNPTSDSTTRNQLEQIGNRSYVLGYDFKLDTSPDALLRSGENMVIHEIPLDIEGHDLILNLKQTGTGEDLAVQGIEVVATLMGYEGD